VLTPPLLAAPKKTEVPTEKVTFSRVYEDGVTAISTVYNDGKTAVSELAPEIKTAIIAIAQSLGVAVEHVYTVLVKKFVVDGVVQLIPFLIGLTLLILGWIKLEKFLKGNKTITWHILYPAGLLAVGIVALTSVNYQTMLLGLINPEYGVINYILEYSKTLLQ
jgi:hypothetical protein